MSSIIINPFGNFGGGAPPAFVDPTSIAGLQLWLDAADAATITDTGGAVSQWNDKSGNTNHATQTLTARPTTGTRTINSKNVIDFDGVNDFFNLTTGLTSSSGQTFFVVFSNDTVTTSRPLISSNDTVAGPLIRTSTGGLFGLVRPGVAVIQDGSPAISLSTNYIGVVNYSTSGRDLYINGTSYGASASSTTFTNGSTWIGGSGAGGVTPFTFLDGVIAEIAVYAGVLSTTDKNSVGNYLASKWGITWTNI